MVTTGALHSPRDLSPLRIVVGATDRCTYSIQGDSMVEKTRLVASARVVLLLACGAAFLSLLDATVVNLAVADLPKDFSTASLTGLSWVISAYAVMFASMLAVAGRLVDVRGARPVFI